MRFKRSIRVLLPCACLALGGCPLSPDSSVYENIEKTALEATANHLALNTKAPSNMRTHQRPWVCKKAIPLHQTERLPKSLNKSVFVSLAAPIEFIEWQDLVHKLVGLSVRLTPDAEAKLQGRLEFSTENTNDQASGNRRREAESGRNPQTESRILNATHWKGSLEGLLDKLSAAMGLSWLYHAGEIKFYYTTTRTFSLYAIPSVTVMDSVVTSGMDAAISGNTTGLASGQSGSSSGGQSSQSTSVSLRTAMMEDILSNVQAMLTPGIGRLSASQATGAVAVTDTVDALDAIQAYLEQENKSITKQVLLNIKVLSLTFKDENQLSLNWEVLFKQLSLNKVLKDAVGTFSIDKTSIRDQSFSGLAGNVKILKGSGDGHTVEALLDALAEQARISVVTSPAVTTLNLQPVPLQIAQQKNYLARVTTTISDGGTATSLEPGTVTSGFNMNLIPLVMENNQLLLQYSINLSELEGIEVMSAGADAAEMKLQLPTMNNRIFSQKVKLKSGHTLILSGFESTKDKESQKGPFHKALWFLNGGKSVQQERSVIVIMITPIIMD